MLDIQDHLAATTLIADYVTNFFNKYQQSYLRYHNLNHTKFVEKSKRNWRLLFLKWKEAFHYYSSCLVS